MPMVRTEMLIRVPGRRHHLGRRRFASRQRRRQRIPSRQCGGYRERGGGPFRGILRQAAADHAIHFGRQVRVARIRGEAFYR